MVIRYFTRDPVTPESLIGFDPAKKFTAPIDRVLARITFGAAVTLLGMIPLRLLIDQFSATAGPYALIYPTVVVATVFGRRTSGFAAMIVSFIWAVMFNIETSNWFDVAMPSEPGRLLVNVLAATIVILLTDLFRNVADSAMAERDREIAHRKMLALEIEHRTKNNFAMVSSLLNLQRRRETSTEAVQALEQAINRIQSFALAYEDLTLREGEGAETTMRPYLGHLVDRFGAAAFGPGVELVVESDEIVLPRETAVAIGLFVNEALTNCVKYAFGDRQSGNVRISLSGTAHAWRCTVSDDGMGLCAPKRGEGENSGLGTGLMGAFARQANARIEQPESSDGYAVALVRD